uniref:Uncharacterized protein n=1 Tax=Cacopsylla melanoneura TaxID=428564 RepID=A0A8D8R9G4_9HEMI
MYFLWYGSDMYMISKIFMYKLCISTIYVTSCVQRICVWLSHMLIVCYMKWLYVVYFVCYLFLQRLYHILWLSQLSHKLIHYLFLQICLLGCCWYYLLIHCTESVHRFFYLLVCLISWYCTKVWYVLYCLVDISLPSDTSFTHSFYFIHTDSMF